MAHGLHMDGTWMAPCAHLDLYVFRIGVRSNPPSTPEWCAPVDRGAGATGLGEQTEIAASPMVAGGTVPTMIQLVSICDLNSMVCQPALFVVFRNCKLTESISGYSLHKCHFNKRPSVVKFNGQTGDS